MPISIPEIERMTVPEMLNLIRALRSESDANPTANNSINPTTHDFDTFLVFYVRHLIKSTDYLPSAQIQQTLEEDLKEKLIGNSKSKDVQVKAEETASTSTSEIQPNDSTSSSNDKSLAETGDNRGNNTPSRLEDCGHEFCEKCYELTLASRLKNLAPTMRILDDLAVQMRGLSRLEPEVLDGLLRRCENVGLENDSSKDEDAGSEE